MLPILPMLISALTRRIHKFEKCVHGAHWESFYEDGRLAFLYRYSAQLDATPMSRADLARRRLEGKAMHEGRV